MFTIQGPFKYNVNGEGGESTPNYWEKVTMGGGSPQKWCHHTKNILLVSKLLQQTWS